MFDCKNLVHPFQNDPGCSQLQRVMDNLLNSAAKIDNRTLAELLNFFKELSAHIKYAYVTGNENIMEEDNWESFFKNSIPFVMAAAAKNESALLQDKFQLYRYIFNKKPTVKGLQLLLNFCYYNTIYKITGFYNSVDKTGLPVAAFLEQLSKNKLRLPVTAFIKAACSAVNILGITAIDFSEQLSLNGLWKINDIILVAGDDTINNIDTGNHQVLLAISEVINNSMADLIQAMDTISTAAGAGIQQSLISLNDDLNQKHTPHLALLFTFLNTFTQLQNDLNGFAKKHLDFFYQQVLQLKPSEVQPDKIHLIFELQKQLKQYALKKGLLVKADKDKNNTEIDFALNDDIVVNKTQVADVRTLFLNNETIYNTSFVEGLYIAPSAGTADGIDKDFSSDPKNYPTLGGKYSKYTAPGRKSPQLYPNARMGFVLASPVLLLNEGERSITIALTCKLNEAICDEKSAAKIISGSNCCANEKIVASSVTNNTLKFIDAKTLFAEVGLAIKETYIIVNEALLATAIKIGLDIDSADSIRQEFLKDITRHSFCCTNKDFYNEEAVITKDMWLNFLASKKQDGLIFSQGQQSFLNQVFKPLKSLSVLFSGEKNWIDPTAGLDELTKPFNLSDFFDINFSEISNSGTFNITVFAKLNADKPALTFFNKDILKEDLGTTLPLAKILLNDEVKLSLEKIIEADQDDICCLNKKQHIAGRLLSLYNFFRNVVVTDSNINVKVCGLKNFIVQNDESVQDVNGPVYPFGTRPAIVDFDAVNSNKNSGDKTGAAVIKKEAEASTFVKIDMNLTGPNFYIGSQEIFSKNWTQLCVKLNWKDKPANFNEHYKAYLKRFNFHDCTDLENPKDDKEVFGLNECDFEVNLALLNVGKWQKDKSKKTKENKVTKDLNRKLFSQETCAMPCKQDDAFKYSFFIEPADFGAAGDYSDALTGLKKYDISARKGFLRFTLENQDFLHKDYAFVLGRQMMALGRFPDTILENAVYAGSGDTVIIYKNIGNAILSFQELVKNTNTAAKNADDVAQKLSNDYGDAIKDDGDDDGSGSINDEEKDKLTPQILENAKLTGITTEEATYTDSQLKTLDKILALFDKEGKPIKELSVLIPNEPWTPVISNIALDYAASASGNDITLIHLYPFKNTYNLAQISLQPSLFPTLCDEGSLFIGLTDLLPGSKVNMLFQLAEATSDTEFDPEIISWKYLYNNQWFALRQGFEILRDSTGSLTTSGIVEFSFPDNMSDNNSVMPAGYYWIKASVPKNSRALSETICIATQAVEASFLINPENDMQRLSNPLNATSVSKLKVADANIKQVSQPYPSYSGRELEATGHYYTRVSELLRHKGRAIQKFDYERMVLEAFPQVYKAKCINHSFFLNAHQYDNDFPAAPGYIMLAVIPDLTKLLAGKSFQPKLPEGIIEKIQAWFVTRISPFVKIRAVNPRYENVHICLSVILNKGYDRSFYKNKLEQDTREFLAPWAVGVFEKLRFGQCVNKSDLVYFLETRDYVDYITKLELRSDYETLPVSEICPHTPRSILFAGEIQICIEEDLKESFGIADCNDVITILDNPAPFITVPV